MQRRSFLLMPALCAAGAARADETAWAQLKQGGLIVLMRHAQTVPGIGDPPGFRLGQCSTQRNLSAAGRDDAVRIGKAYAARAIPLADVWSSRWCRCLDTAMLAFGRVRPVAALDSIFTTPSASDDAQMAALLEQLAQPRAPGNLILVTHAVNIEAMAGMSPGSGEMLLTRLAPSGGLRVLGRLAPDS